MTQKLSAGMSLSALSAGCPGEDHIYVSSARTAAMLSRVSNSARRYNGGDGWVAALKFLITLKRNKKYSRKETISG